MMSKFIQNTSNFKATFFWLSIASATLTFSGLAAAQSLPSGVELLTRATAKSFPRSIDISAIKSGIDWGGRWVSLRDKVTPWYVQPLPEDPVISLPWHEINRISFTEVDKILFPAALWLRDGDSAALAEAKRRALNVASWSPRGSTGYLNNDLAGARLTQAMALAYDWLYGNWTPSEEAVLLSAIEPRMRDILGDSKPFGLDNGRRMTNWPYDSHRGVSTANAAVICTVLAGKGSIYDKCILDVVPGYLTRPIAWGGADGGFSGGTMYAQWDVSTVHFDVWGMLKQTVNVDLWKTSWAQNYIKFIAYFLPPGSPSGVFGDGAEVNYSGVWATQGKIYNENSPSPLANWYARNISGEERYKLGLVFAKQQYMSTIPSELPTGTPHGIHIPSIGWTAMHSDLADRYRTSIYFKSSPYGSSVHSHADQNSFVIHGGGQILAVDSGYYDYWGSPHYLGWYKATRAHNAITVDGGKGQVQEAIDAKGIITQFTNNPDYDLVTGNARLAYGGLLTKAVRSMVYLRPDTVLIFDSLASSAVRTWEWNIHAHNRIIVKGEGDIEILNEGVRLCIRMLSKPDVAFSQTEKFTINPSVIKPNQWHGTFSSITKLNAVMFVALLEVGCRNTPWTVTGTGSSRNVTILGNTFTFDGESVVKD